MSTEENKVAVRRQIEEAYNKGNLAVIDECTAADFVLHTAQEYKGPQGIKQFVTMMRTAFPDLHMTIDDIVAEGDMVVHRFTTQGTFTGELAGTAPTGKKLKITMAGFTRFDNGKQVEGWAYGDSSTMYQQMGITPPGQ